jgi:hypothetical protein
MIIGESAWHKDFWGLPQIALSKSVSLNFPESSMFVKVALVRFEDKQSFAEPTPWVSIGIISVKVVNKFTQTFPLTKGISGTTAANESDKNLYVLFDNRMIEVVVAGMAQNGIGTFTWVLETWG